MNLQHLAAAWATLLISVLSAGADQWLEIMVRTKGGGPFDTLIPRQKARSSGKTHRQLEHKR